MPLPYVNLFMMILLPVIIGMVIFSIACNNQQRAGKAETMSGEITSKADNAKAFMKELGAWVDYREEAIHNGTQGILAVTFEKSEAGQIENIHFLNELGGLTNWGADWRPA